MKLALSFIALCSLVAMTRFASAQPPADAPASASSTPETTPVPRSKSWIKRTQRMNEELKQGDIDIIFLGDSITNGWDQAGRKEWEQRWVPRKAVNLGIGGDRTEHVLWRLDHADFSNIKPKLVVLMIGTNNAGQTAASGEAIARGVEAVVHRIREKLPETKILLLAIFPRGEQPDDDKRVRLNRANEIIAKLGDDQNVFFLDIGRRFIRNDNTISKDIMPDFLHLSPAGYTIWADAIEPKVDELLND